MNIDAITKELLAEKEKLKGEMDVLQKELDELGAVITNKKGLYWEKQSRVEAISTFIRYVNKWKEHDESTES